MTNWCDECYVLIEKMMAGRSANSMIRDLFTPESDSPVNQFEKYTRLKSTFRTLLETSSTSYVVVVMQLRLLSST